MLTTSETLATSLMVLVAMIILGWGFYRARPFGKVGILAWLQSVVLMAPWLLFFGLFAAGIYLNLIGILFLFIITTGLYIYIGNQLRAIGQSNLRQLISNRKKEVLDQNESQAETPVINVVPELIPISDEDLRTIQSIFGIDTFYVTQTQPYLQGAIFIGNLRGEPDLVYSKLSSSLKEKIGDRYRLFLVNNPNDKPVFIVLPSSNDPSSATVVQKIMAVVLFLLSILTTGVAGGILLGFDLFSNWSRVSEVVPIAILIWIVLGAHELGHRWKAGSYDVKLSPPYFIPASQIASFGAITRFESILPNRTALFDIAAAGPILGGLASLIILGVGLILTREHISLGFYPSLFQVPAQFFQGSILVGTLAKVVLGKTLLQDFIGVHPLTIVGWLGLVINALNLMPAGQLDGGRIVQAIYGRKTAQRATIATLILLAIISFINTTNPLILYWAIIILFLQRDLERPAFNDISEPDDTRAALGLLVLFLMVATLLPLTPGLAGRLGIGG